MPVWKSISGGITWKQTTSSSVGKAVGAGCLSQVFLIGQRNGISAFKSTLKFFISEWNNLPSHPYLE